MTIRELKITAYLYKNFSNEDKNYKDIYDKCFDLTCETDQKRMLKFLNDWGCRQFKKEDHLNASEALNDWFVKYRSSLPDKEFHLIDQDDELIKSYQTLFDDLKKSFASTSISKKGLRSKTKTVGPVGAAKTLFALRNNTFPPWDRPVIKKLKEEFKINADGRGYCMYLLKVEKELLELKEACQKEKINFYTLPKDLDRQYSSFPKLMDEYYWVKVTRKCNPSDIINLIENPANIAVCQYTG